MERYWIRPMRAAVCRPLPLLARTFRRRLQRWGLLVHPWNVRAEGEVVRFPSESVEAWARFDTFFEEEHERLFKAL
jgi:hypothetical protein